MTDAIKPGTRVRIKQGTDANLWGGHINRTGTVDREFKRGGYDWIVELDHNEGDFAALTSELEVLTDD